VLSQPRKPPARHAKLLWGANRSDDRGNGEGDDLTVLKPLLDARAAFVLGQKKASGAGAFMRYPAGLDLQHNYTTRAAPRALVMTPNEAHHGSKQRLFEW
jgi:hypothetical protein